MQIIIVGTRAETHGVTCKIMMPEVEQLIALEQPLAALLRRALLGITGLVWLWPAPAW